MGPIKATFTYGNALIELEGSADEIQRCLNNGDISKHLMTAAASSGGQKQALDDETLELCLDHAWGWFSLHSDHRMRSVHFFVVSVAFLTAAFVTANRFAQPLTATVISGVGFLVTIWFSRLDLRIRELIQASEAAMKPLQRQLAERTGIAPFNMFELVEKGNAKFVRYSHVIAALHATAMAMFVYGIVFGILQMRSS